MKTSRRVRPTIEDVARHAGVSTATVSRVVNQTGPVTQETAQRVRDAIGTLEYRVHAAARGLASRRTYALGLIVPDISGEFFQPMLRGIEGCTRDHGLDLLIHCTHRQNQHTSPARYPLNEHNADGLVIFTDSLEESELIRLHRTGFPLVLLHRSAPPETTIPSITVENRAGARLMTDYLIEERGYRQIAFLAGPADQEDAVERLQGYQESLQAHNIAIDQRCIVAGGFSEKQGAEAARELLRSEIPIDAIFAADDGSAIGALTALREARIRVPEDIALVGFDDIPTARHLSPPLTTIRAPIEAAARMAVEQVICLMNGQDAQHSICLPTELVIRQSCGHPSRN